jgi:hypothetical protein
MYIRNKQTTLISKVPKDPNDLKDPKDLKGPKDLKNPKPYFYLANLAFFNQSSKYCVNLVMLK